MSSLMCMALAVYFESRGESDLGKKAVAEVVMNRSIEWNKSICDVVFQPRQFSWTINYKIPSKENKDWSKCLVIANYSLNNQTNYTRGSLYFNNKNMGVRYNKKKKMVIGNHIFF